MGWALGAKYTRKQDAADRFAARRILFSRFSSINIKAETGQVV
jgi:hypothetical protein